MDDTEEMAWELGIPVEKLALQLLSPPSYTKSSSLKEMKKTKFNLSKKEQDQFKRAKLQRGLSNVSGASVVTGQRLSPFKSEI